MELKETERTFRCSERRNDPKGCYALSQSQAMPLLNQEMGWS